MANGSQMTMSCPCGREKVVALGLCATCYTLRRHDEEYFGGLREAVLERDGYACRVCGASGKGKRTITVHHREPGQSVLALMIALCPACHAKVHRTKAVLTEMSPLLLELWREQHPDGQEQYMLGLKAQSSGQETAVPSPAFWGALGGGENQSSRLALDVEKQDGERDAERRRNLCDIRKAEIALAALDRSHMPIITV